MKKTFEIPTVEIILFKTEDILTISGYSLREDELEIQDLK